MAGGGGHNCDDGEECGNYGHGGDDGETVEVKVVIVTWVMVVGIYMTSFFAITFMFP